MTRIQILALLAAAIACTLILGGCQKSGDEATNAELAKIKKLLAETETERDDLKVKVAEISESLEQAEMKIESLTQSSVSDADIKEQLAKMTEERDMAISESSSAKSMIEKLKGQLAEQVKKITGLEDQNAALEKMVEELKKKVGSEIEMPAVPGL